MDVIGQYFLVEKHRRRKGKLLKRRFSDGSDLEVMKGLAQRYAEERGEDFLIVQVVTEVSKPKRKAGE